MTRLTRIAGLGLLAGAALAVAAGPAAARGPIDRAGGPGGLFSADFATLDVDGSGQITEEDLLARATARLGEADGDGNGALDASELAARIVARFDERQAPRRGDPAARAEAMAKRMIERRDADDDAALSVAELAPAKGFGRVIDRFDTDDDNAISAAEYDEAKAEVAARMERRHQRDGGRDRGGWGPRW